MYQPMMPMSPFKVQPTHDGENYSASIEYTVLYGYICETMDVFVIRGNNGRPENLQSHEVTVVLL